MTVFRFAVPAVLVVAGAICLIIGGDVLTPIGIGVAGAAAVVAMSTVFLRIGLAEERDRAQEDAAREHYARTGRWPDEEPPAQEPAPHDEPHAPASGEHPPERVRRPRRPRR